MSALADLAKRDQFRIGAVREDPDANAARRATATQDKRRGADFVAVRSARPLNRNPVRLAAPPYVIGSLAYAPEQAIDGRSRRPIF
jgi:hypothetical protein